MAGYIGNKSSVVSSGAERKFKFTITETTTTLSNLAYTRDLVHVFHNGVRLVDGTDYTATNGTSITLTNAAEDGDEVVVISYASFQPSDTVSASTGGVFEGNITVNADLTVSGNTDINGGTIDGTVIGGSTPAAISGTTGQFGTSLNVDGTITSDGLTVGTAVYPTSGPLSNRNKIINGGFDVWQRGTSFSSSSVNEYSADRFRTEGFSLSTTISRQTFTPGQTDVPNFPTYFCRVATSATVGSGQYWAFQQRIEVPQVVSQGQTYTLSFWIKATSGTISAGALSYGFGSGLVGFPELTTTWQKVTRTLTFGASQISGSYATVYVVYAPQNTTAFSVDIANVQLEVGDVATPFEHRSYGQELALCQRYYEKSYRQSVVPGASGQGNQGVVLYIGTGNSVSNGDKLPMVTFMVVKRAAPTILIWSPAGTPNRLANMTGSDLAAGSATPNVSSDKNFFAYQNSGVTVSGTSGCVEFHYTASAEL